MKKSALFGGLVALLLTACWSDATAYYRYRRPRAHGAVDVLVGIGVLDQGSTGIGGNLRGYGYDQSTGAAAHAEVRLMSRMGGRYFQHGASLRLSYNAGSTFGLGTPFGFGLTVIDLGYFARMDFPCMSRGKIKVGMSGMIGMSGSYADASTGDGPDDKDWGLRLEAARDYDHVSLGGVLSVGFDVRFGAFLLGLVFSARQQFGIDTFIARKMILSAGIRTGFSFGLHR